MHPRGTNSWATSVVPLLAKLLLIPALLVALTAARPAPAEAVTHVSPVVTLTLVLAAHHVAALHAHALVGRLVVAVVGPLVALVVGGGRGAVGGVLRGQLGRLVVLVVGVLVVVVGEELALRVRDGEVSENVLEVIIQCY